MDTRDTAEQAELRRSARQLARELSAPAVGDLEDTVRATRLADAVRDTGWRELRHDDGTGAPLASGVEVGIVADALGATVADVAFAGPVLGADLARRAGVDATGTVAVAFADDLLSAARIDGATTTAPLVVVDLDDTVDTVVALAPDGDGFRLVALDPGAIVPAPGTDLTRRVGTVAPGTPVTPVPDARPLTADDLVAWEALGLATGSADLVGIMRGVVDVSVGYVADRRQYGTAVGSFQAVQHLLAEARTLMEGSLSVALHAGWAVDELAPADARQAARVAKAYCARAARTVNETAVQVHGGIGNTWECIVHLYLRRALLDTQWFGDDGEQLRALQRERLGVTHGLS